MAKTRKQKKETIERIEESLKKQKATYFIDFKNLPANKLFDLREKVKENKGIVFVAKKNLMEIAFESQDVPFKKDLEGQVALVFGFEDEITPVKRVYEMEKEHEAPRILGGVLEGEFIDREQAIQLAEIPSKEELYGRLLQGFKAPVFKLHNLLKGNLKGLLYVLNERSKA